MSNIINIKELNERIERESLFVDTLRTEMGKVIVGQKHLIDTLLIGLLSNGHILLEGVPGLAKTLAITTLSQAVDANAVRPISIPPRRYLRFVARLLRPPLNMSHNDTAANATLSATIRIVRFIVFVFCLLAL